MPIVRSRHHAAVHASAHAAGIDIDQPLARLPNDQAPADRREHEQAAEDGDARPREAGPALETEPSAL